MKNKTTQKQILSSKQSEKAIGPEISTLIATREKWHRKKTKGVNHALLQQLLDFYGDTLCVMDITDEFCFRFSKYLLDRVSQNSTRTYLHKLHAVLEYAVSKCIIQHNPMPPIRKLIPGINSPQRTHLSNQELIKRYCRYRRYADNKKDTSEDRQGSSSAHQLQGTAIARTNRSRRTGFRYDVSIGDSLRFKSMGRRCRYRQTSDLPCLAPHLRHIVYSSRRGHLCCQQTLRTQHCKNNGDLCPHD